MKLSILYEYYYMNMLQDGYTCVSIPQIGFSSLVDRQRAGQMTEASG